MGRLATAVRPWESTWTEEGHRYPRVDASFETVLETESGLRWTGRMASLGPFGAKVRLHEWEESPPEGTILWLEFEPPDGEPGMSLKGILWREDPDGLVIVFLNLDSHEFLRLKTLVNRLPRRLL